MANDRQTSGSDISGDERSLMDNLKLGGGIAGALLLILFLIQNSEEARINVLWMEFQMPLFFALLLAAVLGAFASMLFGFFRRRARRVERREDRRD